MVKVTMAMSCVDRVFILLRLAISKSRKVPERTSDRSSDLGFGTELPQFILAYL